VEASHVAWRFDDHDFVIVTTLALNSHSRADPNNQPIVAICHLSWQEDESIGVHAML
jgi:hypothetical protein